MRFFSSLSFFFLWSCYCCSSSILSFRVCGPRFELIRTLFCLCTKNSDTVKWTSEIQRSDITWNITTTTSRTTKNRKQIKYNTETEQKSDPLKCRYYFGWNDAIKCDQYKRTSKTECKKQPVKKNNMTRLERRYESQETTDTKFTERNVWANGKMNLKRWGWKMRTTARLTESFTSINGFYQRKMKIEMFLA